MQTYAEGLTWGEGPRWGAGGLWVSDTQANRLWTDSGGTWTAHPVESPSNGLWVLPDETVVGAMMFESRVGRWDGEQWAEYADLSSVARGHLGDMTGDPLGNLIVDDVGEDGDPTRPGRIIRVDRDRTARVVADGLQFPNGLALIDEGSTLIVAETAARRLTAFDVLADGELANRRPWFDVTAELGTEARPDGIWAAPDGVWIATLEGCLVAKVVDGALANRVPTGSRYPIACCTDGGGRLLVTLADTHGKPVSDAVREKSSATIVATVA